MLFINEVKHKDDLISKLNYLLGQAHDALIDKNIPESDKTEAIAEIDNLYSTYNIRHPFYHIYDYEKGIHVGIEE